MNILNIAKQRYATKQFDSDKQISVDQIDQIKELLRLSPSSVNSQPWHFILASTAEGKARMAKATAGIFEFNLQKVTDAALVVAFCSRTELPEEYLNKLTEQEWKDGRFKSDEAKSEQHQKRTYFVDMHASKLNDLTQWTTNQVYLNIGAFLLGVGALGLDAVPIEGFNSAVFDDELNLKSKGLKSVALVAVGYKNQNDFNAQLPKSRWPQEEVISELYG